MPRTKPKEEARRNRTLRRRELIRKLREKAADAQAPADEKKGS